MADDIVTRLRQLNAQMGTFGNMGELCYFAADEIERLREYETVADMFGAAFRMDEWGQYPSSNGDDVHQAACAYERLKTKEARRG